MRVRGTKTASVPVEPPLSPFRGRGASYTARSLLEIQVLASIGLILDKPEWWEQWRSATETTHASIRDGWLFEAESEFVRQTFEWTARYFHQPDCERQFEGFPTQDTAEAQRAFIVARTKHVDYTRTWSSEMDAQSRAFDLKQTEASQANAGGPILRLEEEAPPPRPPACDNFYDYNDALESYGQVVWYCSRLRVNRHARVLPIEQWRTPRLRQCLDNPILLEMVQEFMKRVRTGKMTRDNMMVWYPDADPRPHIHYALWVHIDRIMAELDAVMDCVSSTLDLLLEKDVYASGTVQKMLIRAGPIQETYMSDGLVPSTIKDKLTLELAGLENVADQDKDWRPHSGKQVLDLLNPSLYCCVLGRTRCLPSGEKRVSEQNSICDRMNMTAFMPTEVVHATPLDSSSNQDNYQWIPSEFKIDSDGHVSILSYINNLHPRRHTAMYDALSRIFDKFVPMFDRVLSCLTMDSPPQPMVSIPDFNERQGLWLPPRRPEVPESLSLLVDTTPSQPFTLQGRQAQVIVRIEAIHISPDNPKYLGGPWQVDGTNSERIVATGVYVLESQNITDFTFSMRARVEKPKSQHMDHLGFAVMFGLSTNTSIATQLLGGVTMLKDRCFVYPNTLQHKMEPFKLVDADRPGVCKILRFHLIDPSVQIPSSAVIPPQQAEWLQEAKLAMLHELGLPEEITRQNLMPMFSDETSIAHARAKAHRIKILARDREFDSRPDRRSLVEREWLQRP